MEATKGNTMTTIREAQQQASTSAMNHVRRYGYKHARQVYNDAYDWRYDIEMQRIIDNDRKVEQYTTLIEQHLAQRHSAEFERKFNILYPKKESTR